MATFRDWPFFNRVRRGLIEKLLDRKSESLVEMLRAFPAFAPNSAGSYKVLSALTLSSINKSLPLLALLAEERAAPPVARMHLENFPKTADEQQAAQRLASLFDFHGSDKGAENGYASLYGPLFWRGGNHVRAVLEIGLGSTHTDTVSHMRADRQTGASLRAMRDFCPTAAIFGADVDRRALFEEERIRTFFVDQTDPASFVSLARLLPSLLDLIIDDGLHSPEANLNTLRFALPRLAPGGWCVIEDIGASALPLWVIVSSLLPPDRWSPCLLQGSRASLFAVQKKAKSD